MTDIHDDLDWVKRAAAEERLMALIAPAAELNREPLPDRVPATSAQARLHFLDQLEPAGRSYRIPLVLRIKGDLDAAALVEAIGYVVQRHDSLRSVLRAEEGTVWMDVRPFSEAHDVAVVDVPAPRDGWSEDEVVRLAQREALRPFDLGAGPLFRATLFRLADDDHLLVCCMHHAVADAWSVGVLYTDLAMAYDAVRSSTESGLPALSPGYREYALRQRCWMESPEAEASLAYWREHLRDAPAALSLPTDRRRPSRREHRGERVHRRLPPTLCAALEEQATASGSTLATVILSAFALVLHRWSGDPSVVVGMPTAGRTRLEWEPVIGLFSSTVPIHLDFTRVETVRDLLRSSRQAVVSAFAHQDVPFERLVADLALRPDPGRTPVYQVLFAMQSVPAARAGFDGLDVQWVLVPTGGAKFDMSLHAAPDASGMALALEYDLDLFEPETAHAVLDQVIEALRRVAAEPDADVRTVPLTGEAGPGSAMAQWSSGPRRALPERTISELIAERTVTRGNAVALRQGGESVTYAELGGRVDRLAARMTGVERVRVGETVAVLLPRGFDLVTAILATLRCGGAYVPLDARWPADRQRRILQECGARLLVTSTRLRDRLGPSGDLQALCLDEPWQEQGDLPPFPVAGLDDLAYVIFTSGSTGAPKGVMVEHRGLLNHILWAIDEFRVDDEDSVLLQTSVGYDLPVPNLFAPLVAGRTLVLAEADVPDALAGAREMADGGFSFVKVTPSHLRGLLAELPAASLPGAARALVLAGEELRGDDLTGWARSVPDQVVINEYGPAEVSVACTTFHGVAATFSSMARVPIGAPLWNADVHVLDERLQPVPPGVLGEIYVGGTGVARGYYGQAALTADRFVPDPFAAEPGSRMYRTGDQARRRPDGMVVFAGRADQQLKIRGVRVEPGEVENTLRAHEDVSEAAVITRDGTLHAYVVAGTAFDGDDLTSWLAQRLPEQMMPATVTVVEEIPLTGNGKVDRVALASVPHKQPRRWDAPRPATPTERALADLWREVLELRAVGPLDDFFTLGGHSLRAVELVNRMTEAFGTPCPLRLVFERPRLRDLAAAVETLIRDRVATMSAAEIERHLRNGGRDAQSC
ncbi:amino acid adenylation domain-containing protein [Nonomuraea sp. NPDC050663]|uniref:amino acid adenylation domain-containing protein n=1 Tax=Nonomuraea sp. NPDC050663 TaxID=3364370 RepID=UPI003788D9C4